MFYSLDRITEGWAVLIGDDGSSLQVRQDALPHDISEGDVLCGDGEMLVPAPEETAVRRKRITEKLDALLHAKKEE